MKFNLSDFIWCVNLIAFSHIFLQEDRWSVWRYISLMFIICALLVLSFNL